MRTDLAIVALALVVACIGSLLLILHVVRLTFRVERLEDRARLAKGEPGPPGPPGPAGASGAPGAVSILDRWGNFSDADIEHSEASSK